MAWIKLDQNVFRHRKTLTLASRLGIHPCQAVGHLAAIWSWAVDSAPDGRIPYDNEIIAVAGEYGGSADVFAEALVLAGFVDDDFDGHRTLHDWDEWQGALIAKRKADKKRAKNWREARVKQGNA